MIGPGTIFLVGGINDIWLVATGWSRGLRTAGLPHRVIHYRWQQGLRATLTFADLWRTAHHRASAERFAKLIREQHREHCGEPIHVMAHSAGTAITVYALELLEECEAITSAILIGSGLSPRYDLTACLKRCRAGILSVQSWLDCFFLGLGTCLLGCCDRRFSPAAGMVGFKHPQGGHYEKLYTLRWHPRYVRQGWVGGHLSQASPWFISRTIADWVRQAEASGALDAGSGLRANTHSSTG
jgi:pimeloyl-ACP methyl ester carboxylesterase